MAPPEISFGILLIPIQALDAVGPMDILFNISRPAVTRCISADVAQRTNAPNITFHHIGPTLDPVQTTGNLHAKPTTTFTTCPPLDYLLIGGPAPDYANSLPTDVKTFLTSRAPTLKTIFTTCTGALVLAAADLLQHTAATTNHALLDPHAMRLSPTTLWDRERHWVDATTPGGVSVWSAAGAGAGMDMFCEWVRRVFDQELLDCCTMMLEYRPRDVFGKPLRYMNGRGEVVE